MTGDGEDAHLQPRVLTAAEIDVIRDDPYDLDWRVVLDLVHTLDEHRHAASVAAGKLTEARILLRAAAGDMPA